MEAGCYTTSEAQLGVLPAGPLYWHIYGYPSHAAADTARGPRGTAVQVFSRHWLYTIAEEQWRPTAARDRHHWPTAASRRMGRIPPVTWRRCFPRVSTRAASATVIQALRGVVRSERLSVPRGHEWPGDSQCGRQRHGPEGWPMAISAFGPETRRALVLVLHPSAEPYSTGRGQSGVLVRRTRTGRPRALCPK